MAVEAKMGMCIVLILVCAFSFLVYHKYDLKEKALALASIAAAGNDESIVDADLEATTDDRYSEFNPADAQTTLLAGATPDQGAAPSFAGDVVQADVAQPEFDSTQMLLADARPLDTQFDLSEPEGAFEVQPASDLLATREATPEPFDAFSEPEFGAVADATAGEAFAASDFAVRSTEPLMAEPVNPEPSTELTEFQPTSMQPAFDEPALEEPAFEEPAFVDFGEPQPVPSQELFEPIMVADPPAAFTPLPPATDIVDSGQFDSFEVAAPEILPPTEPAFDQQLAAADSVTPKLDTFAEFGPLAVDEPKFETPVDDEVMSSSFEPEPLPTTVVAEVIPETLPQSFSGFQSEPVVTTVIEETPPLRRPAPMPDFDYSNPGPVPEQDPATAIELAELDRHDTLIAMASPAPDVDVFGPEPQVADDATAPAAAQPFLQEPRRFAAEPSDFDGFAQTETVPPGDSKRVASPELVPFPTAETGPRLSIPVPQAGGVARFVAPPKRTVQQVSGISEQCDICEVQPNDNYWRISQRVYGTAQYFSSLALYNRHRIPDPKKLRPGMKVMIPDPKLLEQKFPEFFKSKNSPPKAAAGYFLTSDGSPAYRIGDRETLSAISQKHLGRASRWIQIYRMNRNILKDPNKLKPGIVIALPDDATSVHLAP